MLTTLTLIALARELRGRRVLSVYLDGTATDPARQRAWRTQLDHALGDIRSWLADAPHADREAFGDCVRLLDRELASFGANVVAPGWVAFITEDRVHHASPLPVSMPTEAVWSTGASIAPYMRALKETRPVVLVLVDSARAQLFRYAMGALERLAPIRAHHVVEPPSHMGDTPRQRFHSGTRGATGRDDSQRALREGRDRMVREVAERAVRVAGAEGCIIIAGVPQVRRHLADRVAELAPNRTLEEDLDIHATDAEVADAARRGAASLRNAFDLGRIVDIVGKAEANGLGAVGPAATWQCLQQTCVQELYLTHRYLEEHAAAAEDAVRSAIEQDASVEEVSGAAAARLDALGGIAARLRFLVRQPVAP